MARRYKQAQARAQEALLPPRAEDDVSETNIIAPGQPPFDPAALLKLYLYGLV